MAGYIDSGHLSITLPPDAAAELSLTLNANAFPELSAYPDATTLEHRLGVLLNADADLIDNGVDLVYWVDYLETRVSAAFEGVLQAIATSGGHIDGRLTNQDGHVVVASRDRVLRMRTGDIDSASFLEAAHALCDLLDVLPADLCMVSDSALVDALTALKKAR